MSVKYGSRAFLIIDLPLKKASGEWMSLGNSLALPT